MAWSPILWNQTKTSHGTTSRGSLLNMYVHKCTADYPQSVAERIPLPEMRVSMNERHGHENCPKNFNKFKCCGFFFTCKNFTQIKNKCQCDAVLNFVVKLLEIVAPTGPEGGGDDAAVAWRVDPHTAVKIWIICITTAFRVGQLGAQVNQRGAVDEQQHKDGWHELESVAPGHKADRLWTFCNEIPLCGWIWRVKITSLSTLRMFLPVAMFMTRESVGAPIIEVDRIGTVRQDIHNTWPVVRTGGRNSRAAPSCKVESETLAAAHNCSTLRRQRPTWRDSSTKWSSEEGNSSRWKLSAHGSEFSRRLSSTGDGVPTSATGEHTFTCWQTWGYKGSTAKLVQQMTLLSWNTWLKIFKKITWRRLAWRWPHYETKQTNRQCTQLRHFPA